MHIKQPGSSNNKGAKWREKVEVPHDDALAIVASDEGRLVLRHVHAAHLRQHAHSPSSRQKQHAHTSAQSTSAAPTCRARRPHAAGQTHTHMSAPVPAQPLPATSANRLTTRAQSTTHTYDRHTQPNASHMHYQRCTTPHTDLSPKRTHASTHAATSTPQRTRTMGLAHKQTPRTSTRNHATPTICTPHTTTTHGIANGAPSHPPSACSCARRSTCPTR